jgi:predicted glycoside hydrolase/deacetylase ChbG (UPF0249 family)
MKKLFFSILFCVQLFFLYGQNNNEKILLVRGDDMGSSHSANLACIESYKNGIMQSVELMVPGPWFPEAVKKLNENPGLDVGVHLVVTSEWENIKWRPLTCCPSLVDKDGYFYPMIWQRADFPKGTALKDAPWKIEEIEKEFRAQIEMARKYVPHVSHLNCHMGCEGCGPEIAALVKKLASEYNLDINTTELGYNYISLWGRADSTPEMRIKAAINILKNLKPGKYLFIEHPAVDTPEMQAIGHKSYENVAADRDAVTKVFTSSEVKSAIKKNNIILVSYSTAAKIALLTTHYAYSQQVSGVVTAFKTYPLNNASIRSLKSEKVVKTDSLGIFAIERADGDILLISASGFISQKVNVREASRIYIDLKYAFGETSFRDAVNNGHLTNNVLEEALRKYPGKGLKDYSRYQNIYELIHDEFRTVRVVGTNVYNTMAISFSMSAQVLYVVDNMVVSDISFVSPSEVKKIEFLEGPYASEYGVRGANGIIKITLSYK